MRRFAFLIPPLCLALLAFLIAKAGPETVVETILGASPVYLIPALLLVQVQIVLSAIRWRFTAACLGQRIPLATATGEYYLASLVNMTMPGGMAGDALRAYRMREQGRGGWKAPAKAVVMERVSGQLAFFAVAAAGLLAWPLVLGRNLPDGAPGLGLIMIVLTAVLVLAAALAARFIGAQRLKTLGRDISSTFLQGPAPLIQAGLSLLVVASYIATFMLASAAIGAPLQPSAAITVIPLCLLAMLIPAGLGGWGTREATAAALWPLIGFTAAEGLSASLLYGAICVIGALPGLVVALRGLAVARLGRA